MGWGWSMAAITAPPPRNTVVSNSAPSISACCRSWKKRVKHLRLDSGHSPVSCIHLWWLDSTPPAFKFLLVTGASEHRKKNEQTKRAHLAKMDSEKSRVLIIGGTGFVGEFIVKASARAGHPTFALVREGSASDPAKAKLLDEFKAAGVKLVHGDYNDHENLVKAIKGVDVVISTVGHDQIADQPKIIAAIKEAGNVKRFLPAEFGNDVDRVHAVDAAKELFDTKIRIRRAIEAEQIPYTYIVANFTAGYFLPSIGEAGPWSPPAEKVIIMGDGNAKVVFNYEEDIGTFTFKAIDDPRTLNKTLYIRPADNTYSQNELISLWEKKAGKKLERIYVPELEVLKQIQEAPNHRKLPLSIHHTAFVKGDHTNFEIDPETGVEATQLYPDVKYTTVDEYLNRLL